MIGEKNVLKLMCYSRNTYYVWKREKRPIIELIDKYFEDSEITEFLETGKINKFENLSEYTYFSTVNFLDKLNFLDKNEFDGYNYFTDFLLDYIDKGYEFDKDNLQWIGEAELKVFQNDFIKFLINNPNYKDLTLLHIEELRYLTSFINDFSTSDLLFLNMAIVDNFNILFDLRESNKMSSMQKLTLVMFEDALLKSLKLCLNKDGNILELMQEYKKMIINKLIEE